MGGFGQIGEIIIYISFFIYIPFLSNAPTTNLDFIHVDVSRVVHTYCESDQLPDTMAMHMGCAIVHNHCCGVPV